MLNAQEDAARLQHFTMAWTFSFSPHLGNWVYPAYGRVEIIMRWSKGKVELLMFVEFEVCYEGVGGKFGLTNLLEIRLDT